MKIKSLTFLLLLFGVWLLLFLLLETYPRALDMAGKCYTTGVHTLVYKLRD